MSEIKINKENFIVSPIQSEELTSLASELQTEISIKNIALEVLTNFATALGVSFLTRPFAAFTSCLSHPTLILVAGGLSVYALFGRYFQKKTASLLSKKWSNETDITKQNSYIKMLFAKQVMQFIPALMWAIATAPVTTALVHELGHAITAELLYQNRFVKIILHPEGGKTKYAPIAPSSFGKMFSEKTRSFLVTLAGPALETLFAFVLLRASNLIEKKYPKIAKRLQMMSYLSYGESFLYAVDDTESSDFVHLHKAGIHPGVFAAFFAAVPILDLVMRVRKFFSIKFVEVKPSIEEKKTMSGDSLPQLDPGNLTNLVYYFSKGNYSAFFNAINIFISKISSAPQPLDGVSQSFLDLLKMPLDAGGDTLENLAELAKTDPTTATQKLQSILNANPSLSQELSELFAQ